MAGRAPRTPDACACVQYVFASFRAHYAELATYLKTMDAVMAEREDPEYYREQDGLLDRDGLRLGVQETHMFEGVAYSERALRSAQEAAQMFEGQHNAIKLILAQAGDLVDDLVRRRLGDCPSA